MDRTGRINTIKHMKALTIFIYSLASYAFSLLVQLAFILFIAPWPSPGFHIDYLANSTIGHALIIDLLLLLLFGLQHSAMARTGFKAWFTGWIPPAAERSTYVLASSFALGAMILFWQGLPGHLWQLQQGPTYWLLSGLFVVGWLIAVGASFLIDHFELFGLQQAWRHLRGKQEPTHVFVERLLYRFVRHPIQLGILIGLWATPVMSMSHLLLATGMTVYIFIGLYYEEKDLSVSLAPAYPDYQRRVNKIFPIPSKKR